MLVKNVIWFYFICPDLPPTLLPPVFVFVVLVQRGRSAQRRTSSSSSMVWTRLSSTNQTTVTPLCPFSLKPSISSLPGSNWWSRSEQHYRCLWTTEKLEKLCCFFPMYSAENKVVIYFTPCPRRSPTLCHSTASPWTASKRTMPLTRTCRATSCTASTAVWKSRTTSH